MDWPAIPKVLKNRTCSVCGVKNAREDMRRLVLQEDVKYSYLELMLRHAVEMLLGKRPKGTSRRSWLFGHYQRTGSRTVTRWHCFDCFVGQLTPSEYQYFRSAYHDDMVREQGLALAEAAVARLDALYYPESEAI